MKTILSILFLSTSLSSKVCAQAWEPTSGPRSSQNASQLHADLNNNLFVVCGLLYFSSDRGNTWSYVLRDGKPITTSYASIDSSGKLYVVQTKPNYALIASTDGGNSWTDAPLPPTSIDIFYSLGNGVLILGSEYTLNRSTNDGQTWTEIMAPRYTALGPSGVLYFGKRDTLFSSTDKGISWQKTIAPYEFNHIVEIGQHVYLIGINEIVYKGTVGNPSWKILEWASAFRFFKVRAGYGNTLFAHTHAPIIFRSDDAGETWRELTEGIPLGSAITNIFPDRAGNLYIPIDGILYRQRISSGVKVEDDAGFTVWQSGREVFVKDNDPGSEEQSNVRFFDLLGRELSFSEIDNGGDIRKFSFSEKVVPLFVHTSKKDGSVAMRIVR